MNHTKVNLLPKNLNGNQKNRQEQRYRRLCIDTLIKERKGQHREGNDTYGLC